MINILNFSIKKKIKNFYLASSSEVYGDPIKIPTSENELIKIKNIFNPRFSYSGGKFFVNFLRQTMEENILIKKLFLDHTIFMALIWVKNMLCLKYY